MPGDVVGGRFTAAGGMCFIREMDHSQCGR